MVSHTISLTLIFLVGAFANRWGFFNENDGRVLSKLIIYFTMPALGFLSLANHNGRLEDFIILPAIGIGIPIALLGVSLIVYKRLRLPARTEAIFLSSATVANLGYFLYPFFSQLYGTEGLASLVIYDIGNTVIAYSLTYYIIIKYSNEEKNFFRDFAKILKFPPLWAALLGALFGIVIRITNWELPDFMKGSLVIASQANTLLAMLLLGMNLKIRMRFRKAVVLAILIRMLGGMVLGLTCASILGLTGTAKIVAILAPGMPVGLTNLVYAVQKDLDADFAANLVTLSLLVGFIFMVIYSIFVT